MTVTDNYTRKDRFYLFLVRGFSWLPLPWLHRIGRGVGWIAFNMSRATPYRVVKRNLQLCYPDASPEWIEQTTRKNLISTAPIAFECAKSWGMPADYTPRLITSVVGEDIFREALDTKRGTLVIAPHFGTFELMNAWINQHTPNTIMFKPGKDKGVNQLRIFIPADRPFSFCLTSMLRLSDRRNQADHFQSGLELSLALLLMA
jgi:KDO2-lipid IV(A) lauroyltransferase